MKAYTRRAQTMTLIKPPPDPLRVAIPPNIRDKWRRNPTPELIRRLEFLCACGPKPSDALERARLMHYRAVRAAWETYVYCAFACEFFDGDRGKELLARLRSRKPENLRSAMAECLACWFLAGRLALPVEGDAPGRGKKKLDMRTVIDDQSVGVEVKAPYSELPPEGQPWCGHDGDLLAQCLDRANRQFANDTANILILVPELKTPVSTLRVQLGSALYGEEKITCPIDTRTGGPAGPVTTKFFPEGMLLRRRQPDGKLVKRDGTPGFTRVSAVIVIEEQMKEKYPHPITTLGHTMAEKNTAVAQELWDRQMALYEDRSNECWMDHVILVAHNPYASYPLSPVLFREYVQFEDIGDGRYGWNDGEPL